ncbi:MAG: HAMP domain-containing sensor histidine kinase [Chloroflexota bacterium]
MSLRARLAAWSAGVLALTLIVAGATVYLTVQRTLLETLDRTVSGRAERAARFLAVATQPPYLVTDTLQQTLDRFTSPDVCLIVLDPRGRLVAHSALSGLCHVHPASDALAQTAGTPLYTSSTVSGVPVRVYLTALYAAGHHVAGFLLVARALSPLAETLAALRLGLLSAAMVAVVMAIGTIFVLAQRALRPIAVLTRVARAIASSQEFGRRVPGTGTRDEVGALAATFNEMLASLEAAYTAQKRFVADASHELRAPLTSILGNAEALVRAPDAPAAERAEALSDIVEEAQRLSRLVGGLLSLARADAGQQLTLRPVRLDQLVLESVSRWAAAHHETVLHVGQMDAVCVQGDADRLTEVIVNLLDNAVKYGPAGSPVTCAVVHTGMTACLSVEDRGMGIAPADRPHIFERFYRGDTARGRDEGGSGLGLAISAWIIGQHGGQIHVRNTPGAGSTFMVMLPVVAAQASP